MLYERKFVVCQICQVTLFLKVMVSLNFAKKFMVYLKENS